LNTRPRARRCKRCNAKLSSNQIYRRISYCDEICKKEAIAERKKARRPEQIACSACKKPLDMLSREPYQWKRGKVFFCSEICADAYRRRTGQYQEMSERGKISIQGYKQKHGRIKSYENRAAAVAKNNREAPPKAKYFVRHGRVWGYGVTFYPHEDGSSYRASIAEFPELIVHCKTVKEGLRMFREKFIIEAQQGNERR
jgi:hypothetical protein